MRVERPTTAPAPAPPAAVGAPQEERDTGGDAAHEERDKEVLVSLT